MKFYIGDKVRVIESYEDDLFLKHYTKIGEQGEVIDFYTKWKGKEAYNVRIQTTKTRYETILLARELELATDTEIY